MESSSPPFLSHSYVFLSLFESTGGTAVEVMAVVTGVPLKKMELYLVHCILHLKLYLDKVLRRSMGQA